MSAQIQEIVVEGTLAGVVVGEQLVLRAGLGQDRAREAAAMGLFAIDVQAGVVAGPYSERRARAFAAQAAERRRRMGGPEAAGSR